MPRPLRHLGLALLARVEALPAALRPGRGVAGVAAPGGGGQDAHRLRVVRHEAADVVVGEAAVGVRGAAAASTQVHSVTILVKLMIKPGEMENNSFSNDSAIQLYYKILQCMLYSL